MYLKMPNSSPMRPWVRLFPACGNLQRAASSNETPEKAPERGEEPGMQRTAAVSRVSPCQKAPGCDQQFSRLVLPGTRLRIRADVVI